MQRGHSYDEVPLDDNGATYGMRTRDASEQHVSGSGTPLYGSPRFAPVTSPRYEHYDMPGMSPRDVPSGYEDPLYTRSMRTVPLSPINTQFAHPPSPPRPPLPTIPGTLPHPNPYFMRDTRSVSSASLPAQQANFAYPTSGAPSSAYEMYPMGDPNVHIDTFARDAPVFPASHAQYANSTELVESSSYGSLLPDTDSVISKENRPVGMTPSQPWMVLPDGSVQPIVTTSNMYDSRYDLGGSVNGEDEEMSPIYGQIPQRQPRRYKTVKRVQLFRGNLVLDCQVPPILLRTLPRQEGREFTHMRYSAVTCDPDDFVREQYTLRQTLYSEPRDTELCIAMTMYNEDEVLFTRTMHSVMKNIKYLCSRSRSSVWGPDGWKRIVVCIISDGRNKINARTLSVLATLGIYQDGVAKNAVDGKPVTAHLYEYTAQVSVNSSMDIKSKEHGGIVPVQIVFCLKEKNQKKINSHRWFFNSLCPVLRPNVTVLLDVGTVPGPTSIYKLWKAFDRHPKVGGACGEIIAAKGRLWHELLNPIVAAQNFEYKMSNILDKPTESVFGYISVLPGAFSAYRYQALLNDAKGRGPLEKYFLGEKLHVNPDTGLWQKNMYLAEDRILCWELVSKRNSKWLLHYERSAHAVTDVPDRIPELIMQRRRWLNGSFFAAIHSSLLFYTIFRSNHSIFRKLLFLVQWFYNLLNLIFSWFALANYFIAFVVLSQSMADPSLGFPGIKYANIALRYVYLALLVMSFLLSMGNRPQGSKWTLRFIFLMFAGLQMYVMAAAVLIVRSGIMDLINRVHDNGDKVTPGLIFGDKIFVSLVISIGSTFGAYLISSLMFLDPAHVFTSLFQYLLVAPSFTNVLNVYAFCNVHDVSWGTKGDTKEHVDLGVVQKNEDSTDAVDLAMLADEKDLNAAYADAVHVLKTKPPKEKTSVSQEDAVTDSYRTIRTNVVLIWVLMNGALAVVILSTGAGNNFSSDESSSHINAYMTIILFVNAFFAVFRLIGAAVYLSKWIFIR